MTLRPELTIDRATPADAATVSEMVREIAELLHQGPVTVTDAEWARRLGRQDVIILIARRGDVPIGYVSAIRRLHLWSDRDVLALDDLYVREQERDSGVGQALIQTLASTYAGPEQLTVTWGVEPTNTGAIRFYQRLGATVRHKVAVTWLPGAYKIAGSHT